MIDVFGNALLDFYHQNQTTPLLLFTNDDTEAEEMPIEVFFRDTDELSALEQIAIKKCEGKILDIGAGAGAISLILQKQKKEVYALEINKKACEIMHQLGVKKILNQDIWNFNSEKFDTLLLLMNGIGLCERIEKLQQLLLKLKSLLNPGGQIIFDSSDISYFYDLTENIPTNYFGEVKFCYQYEGIIGKPFQWLYVDIDTATQYAKNVGFKTEIIYQSSDDEYLMRLF